MTQRTPHPLASAALGGGLASASAPGGAAVARGRAQAAVRQGFRHRFAPQLLVTAALLSVGAAVIHAAVAGPHFEVYAPFGLLFLASALGQTIWAVLLLAAPSSRLLVAGVAGNLGILATWALSRTSGLPLGPEPGTPESIGAIDIAASAFELGLVVAVLLLIATRGPLATPGRQMKHFAAIAAAILVAVTGAAFAKEQSGAGHHGAATEHDADPAPDPAHAGSHGADVTVRRPSLTPARAATATPKEKPARPSSRRAAYSDDGHTHATPHAK